MTPGTRVRTPWLCAGLVLLAVACGGASASKGPPKRTVLASEYDDARVGRETSRDVVDQIGVLDDPALAGYVSEIGRKLLRGIPRRGFSYQFVVLDQLEPNAFALPGGYIFVSRGLLALANDEDELACVLGHEITHAAHRHAAAQQEIGRRSNPLAMPWMRAATLSAYGRDMERDADRGGQLLAAAAGYDPAALASFLVRLGAVERLLVGHKRQPSFVDTHPGTSERAAETRVRAAEIRRSQEVGDTRERYLRRVEGISVGQRPEAGVFVESAFVHPDLDFSVRFPPGWRLSNSNAAVGAVEPEGRAAVYLAADLPAGDPEAVAQTFVEKAREDGPVTVRRSQAVKVGAIDAWRMELETRQQGVPVASSVTFIPYRDATWRVTGVARASDWGRYEGLVLATARSFRPLTAQERSAVESLRLRLVTAEPGEALVALGERTGNAWDPAHTAVYNGVFVDHRFRGGELVKIARVERYVPRAAAP